MSSPALRRVILVLLVATLCACRSFRLRDAKEESTEPEAAEQSPTKVTGVRKQANSPSQPRPPKDDADTVQFRVPL